MSDASRILVVSASLEQARNVVNRIKQLVNDHSDLPSSEVNSIPWKITNKYYTAGVHFHLLHLRQCTSQSAKDVPAIIYVWQRGDPYAEHVRSLSRFLSPHDPEVSLAIAVGGHATHADDPTEGPDQFLAEHGFEFIDGDRISHLPPGVERTHDDETHADSVQGLSRVIDALSTIMWPSMVRKDTSSGKRTSRMPMLFDVMPSEEDGLAALVAADLIEHDGQTEMRTSRMRKEMAELERWLVENEELHENEVEVELVEERAGSGEKAGEDPWTRTDLGTAAHNSPTPPALETPSGFEDDFSAFVSAPALASAPSSSITGAPSLAVPGHGLTYHTLPSTSDFGGEDDARFIPTTLGDHEGYETLSDHHDISHDFQSDLDEEVFRPPLSSSFPTRFGPDIPGIKFNDEPRVDPTLAGFDLSEILNTLKSVREDVAGIGDENLRRAYTARLASDFVFNRMEDDGSDVGDVDVGDTESHNVPASPLN